MILVDTHACAKVHCLAIVSERSTYAVEIVPHSFQQSLCCHFGTVDDKIIQLLFSHVS